MSHCFLLLNLQFMQIPWLGTAQDNRTKVEVRLFKILLGRKLLLRDRAKLADTSFLCRWPMWWDQVRFSSRWWPKNLKDFSLKPSPILSMGLPPIMSSPIWRWQLRFLNSMYLVLPAWRVSKFAANQSETCYNSKFTLYCTKSAFSDEIWNVVSYANRMVNMSVAFDKSLM